MLDCARAGRNASGGDILGQMKAGPVVAVGRRLNEG